MRTSKSRKVGRSQACSSNCSFRLCCLRLGSRFAISLVSSVHADKRAFLVHRIASFLEIVILRMLLGVPPGSSSFATQGLISNVPSSKLGRMVALLQRAGNAASVGCRFDVHATRSSDRALHLCLASDGTCCLLSSPSTIVSFGRTLSSSSVVGFSPSNDSI